MGKLFMIWFLLSFIYSFVHAGEHETTIPTLPILVTEIKPLIYRDENKQIKGPWFESFEKLALRSDIKFNYHFVSIPKLEFLLASNRPGCNLALLKTQNRIQKLKINFIIDHKMNSVVKLYQRADDERVWSFKKLQEDKKIKIDTNSIVGVESLAEKGIFAPDIVYNLSTLTRLLIIKRVDLIVGSDTSIEATEDFKKGLIKEALAVKTLERGIGCSRTTPPELTDKLMKAAKSWSLE